MRLLRVDGLRLEDLRPGNIPPYAILSHTWGPNPNTNKVTYGDLIDRTSTDKAGYKKIQFCAEQAMRHSLEYC